MTPEQMQNINAFLSGMIAMGHASAGLFFLRFWKSTKDRLFGLFASAFWVLGFVRAMMIVFDNPGDEHYLLWLRFVAYLIILAAIIDKNLRP